MKKVTRILLISGAVLLISAVIAALLFYFGIIHFNSINRTEYPVIGVDVSSYQGDIDWEILSKEDISFAFIKSTEGSKFVDPNFSKNWSEASKTDLRIGAYHFFSFESSGENQAKHFISTVEKTEGMLPPVIDVEFYGRFKSSKDIDVESIRNELRTLVDKLKEHYAVQPILYVTHTTYDLFVKGYLDDCNLWYRSVYNDVPDDIPWTFWQYSNRHRLAGYNGKEKYIDMNAFCGSTEQFYLY